MAKSLMRLVAIPAFLAGVAKGINFLNDIPVNAYYEQGTNFVLEWEPEDREDTFKLTLDTFLSNPILVNPGSGWIPPTYDYMTVTTVLDDAVKFSAGNYTWAIENIDDREGGDYWYSFGASYANTYASPRSFHLQTTE
ncbi:hypothetical protein F4803DRAFT_509348 [Xylaria telfairii]|nr:hypothetical protein F4803DRAFT_509348 [Xylaria telfairii]